MRTRGCLSVLVVLLGPWAAVACGQGGGGAADASSGLFGTDAGSSAVDAARARRDSATSHDGGTPFDATGGDAGPFRAVGTVTSLPGSQYFGLYGGALWSTGGMIPLDGGAAQPVVFSGSAGTENSLGAAAVLGSGLYILGGGGDGIIGQWENDTYERLDLVARTATSAPSSAINHRLALGVYGSTIYAVGGDPGRDTLGGAQVWLLDTGAGTWSAGPSLPAPRSQAGAAVVGSTLLVAGGVCAADGADPLQNPPCPCTGDCLLIMGTTTTLDLSTPGATWQPAPALPFAAEGVNVVAARGRFYAMGGSTKDAYPKDVTQIVSWASGEAAWRAEGALPGPDVWTALSDGTTIVLLVGASGTQTGTIYAWSP